MYSIEWHCATGKVMKVVFASDGTGGIFPVIAEEITVSMKEIPS